MYCRLAILLILSTLSCSAKVSVVCMNCMQKDIQQAVNTAMPGDTILIKPGTYPCVNLQINKPLSVIGEGYPVLDGQEKDEVVSVLSDNVLISGLGIRNSARGAMKDYAGIRVFKSQQVTIINCMMENTFFGIYLSDSKNITVRGNHSRGANYGKSDTGNGIHLWKCQGVKIENNHIEGHRDGIYFEFAGRCLINNNLCEKNFRYGLHFMFSDNDTYTGNTFSDNGTGVAVMYSKGVQMIGNYFTDNRGDASYGLLLKDMSNGVISRNTFSRNTIAVTMEGSNRMHFEKNNLISNGYALKITASCQQDTIVMNNFSGNTFDVGTNGTLNDNYLNRNYWDKYTGYDLNRDNIGDIPYQPVSLYSVIIEQMPFAVILLRSLTVELMDRAEKSIPSLVPETIQDKSPLMKMILQ